MSLPSCCRKNEVGLNGRGFSLVEILVVMVILGIMAGIATPTVGRIFDNLKYRQQVRKYSAIMRYAKLLAVSRGEVVRLKFAEGEECVFQLMGPVEESRDCGLKAEDKLTLDPGEVLFYPDGIATPALLTFQRGDRVKKIRLDMLTAMPIVE